MQEVSSRLKSAYGELLKRNLVASQKDVAKKMKASPSNVSSAFKGEPKVLTNKFLQRFNNAFDGLFNINWLLTGEGEMLNTQITSSKDFASYDIDKVPLIPDEAIAGFQGGFIEGVNYFDCRLVRSPFPGAEIAIQVSGDSMMPAIKSGDRLYLRKIDEKAFIPWGHPVVLDTVNGAVVKAIQPCPNDEDCILAVSTNPKYPPYKIDKSAINGIYKILGSITINSVF